MPGRQPPTGTVTFLFTDIEGSTRLWESHPEAMRGALARHDELLRRAIEANDGFVFKTVGDAFCAAMATPSQAVEAAIAAQLAVLAEPWPAETPLRVRMAIHAGAVEMRDDDYFGLPVNRGSRLLAIAHGGQILVSAATQELVRDALPAGVALLALGEHRLKDLGRAESAFQLCHPGLPSQFERLRSLDHPELQHNLPQQLTSFVGRDRELDEIRGLWAKTRLVTLTGAGGCGKSRLALQAAADLLDGSGDGVWIVELASLTAGSLIAPAIARALGVKEEPGRPIADSLMEHLRTKRLLLVLDNCEHVLEECAATVDAILRNCPGVAFLATSREALGIAGETAYRVPSLSLPDLKVRQTAESLGCFDSVRLFVDRASQANTDFVVTNATAPALASICHRLDGIPLAIELAAARVRSLSLAEIDRRLDQRFHLLTGGSRSALPRQQTLRALIDWSYDLLEPDEKSLLQRLAVFVGGWTLEAAERVGAGNGIEEWRILDLLVSLCDKSLVSADPCGSEVRYRLLETVREYALGRQAEEGGPDMWRGRHAEYFLELAEEGERQLKGGAQADWLDRLTIEHDNIRAALEWCAGGSGDPEWAQQMAAAMRRYWEVRGHFQEGRARLSAALAAGGPDSPARARALSGSGVLAWQMGDLAAARSAHEEALALWRRLGDDAGLAASLNNLGLVAHEEGDYAASRELFEQGQARFLALGDRWAAAAALSNLGNLALDRDDWDEAQRLHEESLALRRELGDRQCVAISLGNLGALALRRDQLEKADRLYRESLEISRELDDRAGIADALAHLSLAAMSRSEWAAACEWEAECLRVLIELGDSPGLADALERLSLLAHGLARPLDSARLAGAGAAARVRAGGARSPLLEARLTEAESAQRAGLGATGSYDEAWEAGRRAPLEETLAWTEAWFPGLGVAAASPEGTSAVAAGGP